MPWTASSGRGVRPSPVSTSNKDAPEKNPGAFSFGASQFAGKNLNSLKMSCESNIPVNSNLLRPAAANSPTASISKQQAVHASFNVTAFLRIRYLPALANVCATYCCGISTSVYLSRILIAPMALPGKFAW